MKNLVPCASCCELLLPGVVDCPWCGLARSPARTALPQNAILVGMGLVLGTGCTSTALYGVMCTDSACPPYTTPGTPTTPTCDSTAVSVAGAIATVSGTPLGLDDTAQGTAISGTLYYAPCVPDGDDSPDRGEYDHGQIEPLELSIGALAVTGSGRPIAGTENFGTDTFSLEDGAFPIGDPRLMSVDGTAAPDLYLSLRITDTAGAALADDSLPAVFPMDASMAHTFSLQDDGGTLLIQLDTMGR